MALNFLNNGYFAGKVGIGTNSPDAKLHIEGGIGIFNVTDDWQQSSLGTYLFRGANFATTISNETSTLKIFPVEDGNRAVGKYWGGINFMHLDPENSSWGTSFTGSQFWIGGRVTSLSGQELSALVFATNSSGTAGSSPTEKMVILPNGNVGIGTTNPSFQLSIENHATTTSVATLEIDGKRTNGTDGAVGEMIFSNNGDTFATVAGFRDGADNKGSLQFQTQDSTFATRMTISSEGNVLIGNTVVNPASGFSNQKGFGYDTGTGNLEVASTSGTPMTIGRNETAAGEILELRKESTVTHSFGSTDSYLLSNVGIGITGPQSKLQVDGGIQMADDTDTASATKVGTMRYRTGTEYVEVTGTELVTNGDFASSTSWELRNSASINNGTGVATVPGAGALGSTNGNWSLSQASVFAPSTLYKVRFQARRSAGTASEMYVGQSYSLKFNQVLTADWVQYEVVFTSTSNVGWSDLSFGGVVGTTSEVKEVSVVEVTAEDASYADMCMQTGASTYEWVNIVRNTY